MHKYTPEYFGNRAEQARIASALYAAIPDGVEYYNLVIALSQMINTMLDKAFNDEIFHHKTNQPTSDSEDLSKSDDRQVGGHEV